MTIRKAHTTYVWEMVEIVLEARESYRNPYTEVDVWVDLSGPGFSGRCHGFWDGDARFCVRVLANAPGQWQWTSGSNRDDAGLNGRSGTFTADVASGEAIEENPNLRGFIRPTGNGHALEYADGTPFFLLGDTWWTTPTHRFPWYDDDTPRPVGPGMGFKDMVAYRKKQGYNNIAILAALPAWANDGRPHRIVLDDEEKTVVRYGWRHPRTGSTYDVHNEGGRAFLFPGKVPGCEDVFPDVNRINPRYFAHMDKKIHYLWQRGFVPFIEAARRDVSRAWRKFYDWPVSYSRYVQYIWARYHAWNTILSPIHFDTSADTIPGRDFNEAVHGVIDTCGRPPFGNLLSANCSPSTLVNFGGHDEAPWITLHQIGNWREHDCYWYLTEIFNAKPPKPALNGEPYYAGYFDINVKYEHGAAGNTDADNRYVRSGMYGSFLSGGLAGHIYGAEGLWGADADPESHVKYWEALRWESGAQMRHLATFALSEGNRYRDLVPEANLLIPNQTHRNKAYEEWAYCARTPDRGLLLAYFEKRCPLNLLRGLAHDAIYEASWFDPRNGAWREAGTVAVGETEIVKLDEFLTKPSDEDWGLKLKRIGGT